MGQSSRKVAGREIASRLSTTKSITSAITALVICVGLFIYLNSLGLNLVRRVKTGHPTDYPNITYEDAFAKFYSNPKWENASTGDQKIVRFSGECMYDGKQAKVILNYWVDKDSFKLHDGTIDGRAGGVLELYQLDRKPFETYKK